VFLALSFAPQIPVQGTVDGFVMEHMPADPLMTDLHGLSISQPVADLFRTPLFAQQPINQVPGLCLNAPADFALPPN